MAKYKSRYPELAFYVNGNREQFSAGNYETTDKATIDVLEKVVDAIKQDEPKPEAPKAPSKAKTKPSGK